MCSVPGLNSTIAFRQAASVRSIQDTEYISRAVRSFSIELFPVGISKRKNF